MYTLTQYRDVFTKLLLPSKAALHIFLCVCQCVDACMRVPMCEWVRLWVGVGAWTRAYACPRVTLLVQHKTRAWAILSLFLALSYFSTLSQKQHDFRKQVTESKM
jgi:hypothetical protein